MVKHIAAWLRGVVFALGGEHDCGMSNRIMMQLIEDQPGSRQDEIDMASI